MDTPSSNNPEFFKTAHKGDRPSASEHNKITAALRKLLTRPNVHRKHYAKIRLMRPQGPMGKFNSAETATQHLQVDRPATFRYFNVSDNEFKDADRTEASNLCDPFGLVYDYQDSTADQSEDNPGLAGADLLCVYSEQAGKWLPLNPRTVRHAITCRDNHNNYPGRSVHPDTYPIRFIKLTYTEQQGHQGHTFEYYFPEPPVRGPGQDAFCHNIADASLDDAYIPEFSLIVCYNVTGQWFTFFNSPADDSSLSDSKSSISESSSSSSSSSSRSGSSSSSSSSSKSSSSSSTGNSSGSSQSSLSLSSASSLSQSSNSSSSRGSSASSASSSSLSSSSSSGDDRFLIHRGITIGAINKGNSGSVTRYIDGTSTPSTITDTVNNDFANVGSGKVVAYAKIGNNFYLIAVECPPT